MSHPTPLLPDHSQRALVTLGDSALTTYRWLRVGLLVALSGILVSIALEWWRVPGHCFQGSISEYYWTPVRPVLVGGLFVMAFGLVCVRGNSTAEDVALNLAGLVTPLVAVVPMRPHTFCTSAPEPVGEVVASAENGVRTLLVLALAVILTMVVVMVRRHEHRRASWTGVLLALATVVGFGLWSLAGMQSMVPAAHYVAAAGLFSCLGYVVARNARETPHQRLTPLYWLLCLAMVLAVVLHLVTLALHSGGWGLLATEVVLAGSFAVFWAVQTVELWHQGVRPVRCRP